MFWLNWTSYCIKLASGQASVVTILVGSPHIGQWSNIVSITTTPYLVGEYGFVPRLRSGNIVFVTRFQLDDDISWKRRTCMPTSRRQWTTVELASNWSSRRCIRYNNAVAVFLIDIRRWNQDYLKLSDSTNSSYSYRLFRAQHYTETNSNLWRFRPTICGGGRSWERSSCMGVINLLPPLTL